VSIHPAGLPGHPDPRQLIAKAISDAVRPQERLSFPQWLPKNIVLVDGRYAGEPWLAENAPYLIEPAECLSDDHPCNLVTIRKSQQSGASILALAWCLYVADREPANMLYGVPGLDALRDINSTKLQPLIDAWHKNIGKTVILPQTSRSGVGSTTYEKKFPGGYIALANANAVMDLSMKTVKKGVKDEVSKWQDIPGFGDPEKLYFGRFTAFRRTKDYKILEISTPEVDSGDEKRDVDGHCRIDRSFWRSDRRFWNCICPECGKPFVHQHDMLMIDAKQPHKTVYPCHCGHHLSEAERIIAVRAGFWKPTADADNRHPGFHVDAFISTMMSYEAIAEDSIGAKNEIEKKAFHNLVLGLPYKYGGDAPEVQQLLDRREADLKRYYVPPRGLLLTAFADVQMRGIWLEIVAHAPNGEKWVIEANYLDGDTSRPNNAVFEDLRKQTVGRDFPDAFGGKRTIDALGIDSGYRAHVVYSFVRSAQQIHPLTGRDVILATKGLNGWGRPAIGQPQLVDIDLDGKKIKQGAKVWGLGTWPLKASHYTDLHIERKPEDMLYPDGYCHHGMWLDEVYFKQLTAEHLKEVRFRGRITGRVWEKNGPNHFLDCRIGNNALAEYLGLNSSTPEQWAMLAQARGLPPELSTADIFTPHRSTNINAPAKADGLAAARKAAERSGEQEQSPAASEWLKGFDVKL
jgi:phage terminase large subunit GpA-like protein